LDWQRLEGKRLGERLGASTVLFMGMAKRSWPWIVAHIPRNLEGGEASLSESSSGRLGFKLSHIRLTGSAELQSECYSGMVLFGQMLLNGSSKIANKKGQRMESGICGKQNYKGDQSFSYKFFKHSQMFKYFAITLEASDIVLLILSSSFWSAS
jgi:hypothetical protein